MIHELGLRGRRELRSTSEIQLAVYVVPGCHTHHVHPYIDCRWPPTREPVSEKTGRIYKAHAQLAVKYARTG